MMGFKMNLMSLSMWLLYLICGTWFPFLLQWSCVHFCFLVLVPKNFHDPLPEYLFSFQWYIPITHCHVQTLIQFPFPEDISLYCCPELLPLSGCTISLWNMTECECFCCPLLWFSYIWLCEESAGKLCDEWSTQPVLLLPDYVKFHWCFQLMDCHGNISSHTQVIIHTHSCKRRGSSSCVKGFFDLLLLAHIYTATCRANWTLNRHTSHLTALSVSSAFSCEISESSPVAKVRSTHLFTVIHLIFYS